MATTPVATATCIFNPIIAVTIDTNSSSLLGAVDVTRAKKRPA